MLKLKMESDYTVGSIADLISGKNTPNKPKVKTTDFKKPLVLAPAVKPQKKIKKEKAKLKREIETENSNEEIDFSVVSKPKKVKTKGFSKTNKPVKRKLQSTSDEEEVEPKRSKITKSHKENAERRVIDKEKSSRTIFVGNVPLNIDPKKLSKHFSKYGTVQSARLRSAPVADTKISKKVAVIKKTFHKERNSINAYVEFETREAAIAALSESGKIIDGHHIRVTMVDEKADYDQRKAIFVGNIPFGAEEEELWNTFAECGNIVSVRLVRDPRTSVGKGFGYVNFESTDAVELALQMSNIQLNNRELRISRCVKKDKEKKQKKPKQNRKPDVGIKVQNTSIDDTEEKDTKTPPTAKSYQGFKFNEKKKKFKPNKGSLDKKKLARKIAPNMQPGSKKIKSKKMLNQNIE